MVTTHHTKPVKGGTRASALESASRLFGERGYGDVSIRDIAASVGISTSTLYHHFADKRAILFAVTESFMLDFNDAMMEAAGLADPAPEKLRNIVIRHLEFQQARRHNLLTGQHFRRVLGEDQRSRILDLMRVYRNLVRSVVIRGISDGDFMIDDPEMTVSCILDMLNGVREWFSEDGPKTIQSIGSAYAEAALRVCGAPGDRRVGLAAQDAGRSELAKINPGSTL